MKKFSYAHYLEIISHLSTGRKICSFSKARSEKNFLVVRHDVDYSLDYAISMAKVEAENGIDSVYMLMCNSDYYNLAEKGCAEKARQLASIAANVGVHYDLRGCKSAAEARRFFDLQKSQVEFATGRRVESASAHQPLESGVKGFSVPPELVDCYAEKFFKTAAYISDSCQLFKNGDPLGVKLESSKSIQFLTHPIWWTQTGKNWKEIITDFFGERRHSEETRLKWLFEFYAGQHARQ